MMSIRFERDPRESTTQAGYTFPDLQSWDTIFDQCRLAQWIMATAEWTSADEEMIFGVDIFSKLKAGALVDHTALNRFAYRFLRINLATTYNPYFSYIPLKFTTEFELYMTGPESPATVGFARCRADRRRQTQWARDLYGVHLERPNFHIDLVSQVDRFIHDLTPKLDRFSRG
jgi:hypothetical protein